MPLVLTEDQRLLKESAEGFYSEKSPISALRHLRDQKDEDGFDRSLWAEGAEMGFSGVLVDEVYGGVAMGPVAAAIVAEAMAKTLVASPYLSSSVTAALIIDGLGSDSQKDALLPQIASGDQLVVPALDEASRHDLSMTALTATKDGGDGAFILNGSKTFVPDGHVADKYLVLARTAGEPSSLAGLSLLLIDRGTPGLVVDRMVMADSRNWARLTLEAVKVDASAIIGPEDEALEPLEGALDIARLIIAAELLGLAEAAFATTLDYIKERKQFGVAVASFQALQHRASHLYSEIEQARSAVLKGLHAAEAGGSVGWFASLAKAKACKVAELATNEAIQMHGGVGMTDEYDVGLFIKRARSMQLLYGDYHHHLDRFARLSGY